MEAALGPDELVVPNVVALAGAALLVLAFHLQVRAVEEPYMLGTHEDEYRRYAVRTGQFLPGVGRLRTPSTKGTR